MFWPIHEYVEEWRLPLVPSSGEGAPVQIVDACGAVGRDLHDRRYGPDVDLTGALWTISLLEDGNIHVGFDTSLRVTRSSSSDDALRSFSFGGPHIDQALDAATVMIADAVQGELAGYPPYIQWPIEEKRLLLPVVRNGAAVWRDPRTHETVAEIGLLGPSPS